MRGSEPAPSLELLVSSSFRLWSLVFLTFPPFTFNFLLRLRRSHVDRHQS